MRVAGTSYTDSMVAQMNLLAAPQYKLQQQAATGQRIQAPSDDPAGMQQALGLQAESSNVSQYAENIATLQARSNAGYAVLQQLQTISNRVSEIATQVDGTTADQAMQSYATEVTQLIQQAAQLVNTKDNGQYLFGGTASGQLGRSKYAPSAVDSSSDVKPACAGNGCHMSRQGSYLPPCVL